MDRSQNSEALPNKARRPRLFLKSPLLWVVIFLAVPSSAFADAGTPLMWAGMLHLLFGNALIGLVEGLLLAMVFSLREGKCVGVMILANYFSAWVGGFLIETRIAARLHLDLNNGWTWFWILVVVTYVMTLVLEWPFVALCFRGSAGWFKRSLKGNLLVNSFSYVVLFGWYWAASGTSLYTKMQVVSPQELSLSGSVLVYFISGRDGDVYARTLAGNEDRRVFDLHSTNSNDRLFARLGPTNQPDTWDLVARLEDDTNRDGRLVEIQTNFATHAVLDSRAGRSPPQYPDTWFNFGKVSRLGDADKSDWNFRCGFWPGEGLYGTNAAMHVELGLAFETPFGSWTVRNATQLPGDKVLFQLGDDQICVLDPNTKRVALLFHGRGPVAVIPKGTNAP